MAAHFAHLVYGFAQFLLAAQLGIRPVLGETVIEAIKVPAGYQQMVHAHCAGLQKQIRNVPEAVYYAAALVLKIVMRHQARALFEPLRPVAARYGLRKARAPRAVIVRGPVPIAFVQREDAGFALPARAALQAREMHNGHAHARPLLAKGFAADGLEAQAIVPAGEIQPGVFPHIEQIRPQHGARAGITVFQHMAAPFVPAAARAVQPVAIAIFLPFPVHHAGRLGKPTHGVLHPQTGVVWQNDFIVLPGIAQIDSAQAGELHALDLFFQAVFQGNLPLCAAIALGQTDFYLHPHIAARVAFHHGGIVDAHAGAALLLLYPDIRRERWIAQNLRVARRAQAAQAAALAGDFQHKRRNRLRIAVALDHVVRRALVHQLEQLGVARVQRQGNHAVRGVQPGFIHGHVPPSS